MLPACDFAGLRLTGPVSFRSAIFTGETSFAGARFPHGADFNGCEFQGPVSFEAAKFGAEARFKKAKFRGEVGSWAETDHGVRDKNGFHACQFNVASFEGATFAARATFSGAHFTSDARFDDTEFAEPVRFVNTTFQAWAGFDGGCFRGKVEFGSVEAGAKFHGNAGFRGRRFEAAGMFGDAEFDEPAWFDGARFEGNANFGGAIFRCPFSLGPLEVAGELRLDDATCEQRFTLEAVAASLSCVRTRFREGGKLQVGGAEVVLDEADFGRPTVLASVPVTEADHGRMTNEVLSPSECRSNSARPSVVSLRGANVGMLTLSRLDLRPCRFLGAHNLEQLRLEEAELPHSPEGWRWTRRLTIADEHDWRILQKDDSWNRRDIAPPKWLKTRRRCKGPHELLGDLENPTAGQVEMLYRALRRGRETQGNQPGAGDFYYGEMEMRRLAPRRDPDGRRNSVGEWTVLSGYWLVAGYGMRAFRAVIALLVTIVLFAVLFMWVGFSGPVSPWRAALVSAESATALFRTPDDGLSEAGQWLQVALRLLGPLFFGLALVSLRGRVKR